jgi:hypothetical protein
MTVDLNKFYSLTIFTTEKIGPKKWEAKALLFRRDTGKPIEKEMRSYYGGSYNLAQEAARLDAKKQTEDLGIPSDWQGELLN